MEAQPVTRHGYVRYKGRAPWNGVRFAQQVLPAHPRKLRVIAESTRKSDKLDAQVLAEFLALNMISEAHRATPRQRQHRRLVRQRPYLL